MGTEDELDALFEGGEDARPEAVEEQPQAEPQPEPEQPEAPEPAPEPQPTLTAPIIPHQPEPGFIPIQAMLEEREKRQAAEARAAQFEAMQAQSQHIPDVFESPEQYTAFIAQQIQEEALKTRLDMSEEFARSKHGDDVVEQTQAWVAQQYAVNPAFRQAVLSQRNPYEFAVQQYQRQHALEKLGGISEVDQFLAWKAAQSTLAQPQQAAPAAAPAPVATQRPPRSLASAPAAGNLQTQIVESDEDSFRDIFKR